MFPTSESMALRAFENAAARVPAYQQTLAEAGVRAEQLKSIQDFKSLPVLEKRTTFQRFDVQELCVDGFLGQPGTVLTSSGHSGIFAFGVTDADALEPTVKWIDESLDLFRAITSNESPVGDILIGQQLMWQANLFAPPLISDEMLRKLEVWHQPTKPDYTFKNTDLTVIDTIKNIMGFHAADLRVDVAEKRDPATLQLGNFTFRFWWQDDTFITHEQLSYGQKRLLFFFYYLACNTDVVIADELVNGLHHRWIATSVEAIGPRQAFLTSQNPLLLDYIPITSTDEVRRSFVLCRSAPREGPPGWIWENMSEGDAQELYNAYEVGVEHVSEILQSRGLW